MKRRKQEGCSYVTESFHVDTFGMSHQTGFPNWIIMLFRGPLLGSVTFIL